MVHVPEKPEQNRLKTMKTIDLAGGMLPGARKVGTYRWHAIHRVRELALGAAEKISNFKHEQIDGICVGVWIFGLNVFSVSLHFWSRSSTAKPTTFSRGHTLHEGIEKRRCCVCYYIYIYWWRCEDQRLNHGYQSSRFRKQHLVRPAHVQVCGLWYV